jgi:Tfp pilus assembly protein PilP
MGRRTNTEPTEGAMRQVVKSSTAAGLVARVALAMVVALGAAACDGGKSSSPPPRPKKTAEEGAAPPPVAPLVNLMEDYQRPDYPVRRRNPFQPDPDVVQPARTEVAGEVRPLDPLESFALQQLRLVTVISETAVPLAMFIDPSGLGHFVKEGDRIGRNSGVVASIRDNEVEIREGGDEADPLSGAAITVRLRDLELAVGEEGLSDAEQEALRRLLESEEGRAALEQTYRQMAPGASAADDGFAPRPIQGGDSIPGLAPPSAGR